MASNLLLQAKAGTLPLREYKSVSNKGSITDIRDRHKNYVEGNIRQYAMMGSQNAIQKSGSTTASVSTQTETTFKPTSSQGTSTETEFRKPTGKDGLLGRTRKVLEAEVSGTETTFKPKAANPNAVEPSEKPPFDVQQPQGKQAFEAYAKYLAEKYTRPIAQVKIDDIFNDSGAFSLAIASIRKMELAIKKFETHPTAGFAQFLAGAVNDILTGIVSSILDKLKDVVEKVLQKDVPGNIGKIAEKFSGVAFNTVKGILGNVLNFKNDYVQNLKTTINELFEVGGYAWKRKYRELADMWDKQQEEIDKRQAEEKEAANRWLNSPEGREWTAWYENYRKTHKTINMNETSAKQEYYRKKYEDRLKKEEEAARKAKEALSGQDFF